MLHPFEFLQFVLWGFLKDKVYNLLPKTLDDLKANVEKEIKNILKNILGIFFQNHRKIGKLIISAEGGNIEIK